MTAVAQLAERLPAVMDVDTLAKAPRQKPRMRVVSDHSQEKFAAPSSAIACRFFGRFFYSFIIVVVL